MKEIVVKLQGSQRLAYSLEDVQNLKLIPWAKDARTVRKLIAQDRSGPNLLQTQITGVGNNRRYLLSREGIIRYLQVYGPQAGKLKQNGRSKKADSSKDAGSSKKGRA